MEPRFTILFNYSDILFIGEVQKFIVDSVPVYEVTYAIASHPKSSDRLEVYLGSGAGRKNFWRQRYLSNQTFLVNGDLIEIIGQEITSQENLWRI